MPSYLDLGLLAVVLISALLAMLRGFTREVMAIFSWGVAAAAAVYFYPLLVPKLADPASPVFIAKEALRPYAAGAAIFFVALILVSLITIRMSDAILDSKIGALDRSLGFLFGAVARPSALRHRLHLLQLAGARRRQRRQSGIALRNQWLANSRSLPLLKATSDQLLALLPDDPDGLLAKFKKPKQPAASDDTPPPESDSEPKAAPPTAVAARAAHGPKQDGSRAGRPGRQAKARIRLKTTR